MCFLFVLEEPVHGYLPYKPLTVDCLLFSDELASEALYSSWKPFMNGNAENNKVKLVIETQPSDVSTT